MSTPRHPLLASLAGGLHVSWLTVALIAAINTAMAGLLWIEDPRPFWHPLVSAQIFGFVIAYCVNVALPWDKSRPILRLIGAVAIGACVAMLLVILVKGYSLEFIQAEHKQFGLTVWTGFMTGLFFSLFFLVKYREARAQAALLTAEAERHLLSKQAVESELKLMQAQIEPHFLFNTLASVQYLTETNPPQATRLLGHLIAYLRAALPQLRSNSTTLGKEAELALAYLSILGMRMGPRLAFSVDIPEALKAEAFPPTLLVSIVENAVKHGLEPEAEGGSVTIGAHRHDDALVVTVTDTGRGIATGTTQGAGQGIGLANVRERLVALYGAHGRFTLEDVSPHGCRATIEIPAGNA